MTGASGGGGVSREVGQHIKYAVDQEAAKALSSITASGDGRRAAISAVTAQTTPTVERVKSIIEYLNTKIIYKQYSQVYNILENKAFVPALKNFETIMNWLFQPRELCKGLKITENLTKIENYATSEEDEKKTISAMFKEFHAREMDSHEVCNNKVKIAKT